MHEDFERLGVFYLGRLSDSGGGDGGVDAKAKANNTEPVGGAQEPADATAADATAAASKPLLLYQSKDLLTHGVCIGMTGSGKTGLCLNLIEEAAIDLIPVIAIDPKGDLGNLLLTFPDLKADDFKPWISADEARRLQVPVDELAQQKADMWSKGLAAWGESGQRIQKLKESADFAIYTPGSTAGLPVSILGSLEAPPASVAEDDDLLRERVANVATCLLTLLGISADPLKSREHILLANIVDKAWRDGRSIDLQELIRDIQNPPMKRIGALDLETFFPQQERADLALSLNNLLAAPGFDVWLKGAPLNIEEFLYTDSGKPRVSIFSIAHLNDTERMFFVTMLLQQVLAWMRTQSGSSSLRAILYMDEIYGYFPPVANPPSKTPLLTLLKQARAYGVGVLLASQNSVDLDYKGLANAGTWFIGRLQTERDKMRLLDGLEGAAAESGKVVNRQDLQKLLGRLRTRLFLLNNIHEEQPVVFETRWTLSYLFGPLARNQIKALMAHRKEVSKAISQTENLLNLGGAGAQTSLHSPAALPTAGTGVITGTGDIVPRKPADKPPVPTLKDVHDGDFMNSPATLPGIAAPHFVPLTQQLKPSEKLVYKPVLYASAALRFTDQKAKLDCNQTKYFVVDCEDSLQAINWNEARQVPTAIEQLSNEPLAGARFFVPPAAMTKDASYKAWKKEFLHWLLGAQKFYLLLSPSTKEYSNPGETEREFRSRLTKSASEKRDAAVQKIKTKFAPRLTSLEDKIRRAQAGAEQAQVRARQQQVGAAIDIGATVLGAIVGRRGSTGALRQAQSAAKDISRMAGSSKSIEQTNENLEALREQLHDLDFQFKGEVRQIELKYNPSAETLEPTAFGLKQTNVSVALFVPVWAPYAVEADGALKELWR